MSRTIALSTIRTIHIRRKLYTYRPTFDVIPFFSDGAWCRNKFISAERERDEAKITTSV
jgi:hypothetical protein